VCWPRRAGLGGAQPLGSVISRAAACKSLGRSGLVGATAPGNPLLLCTCGSRCQSSMMGRNCVLVHKQSESPCAKLLRDLAKCFPGLLMCPWFKGSAYSSWSEHGGPKAAAPPHGCCSAEALRSRQSCSQPARALQSTALPHTPSSVVNRL